MGCASRGTPRTRARERVSARAHVRVRQLPLQFTVTAHTYISQNVVSCRLGRGHLERRGGSALHAPAQGRHRNRNRACAGTRAREQKAET